MTCHLPCVDEHRLDSQLIPAVHKNPLRPSPSHTTHVMLDICGHAAPVQCLWDAAW